MTAAARAARDALPGGVRLDELVAGIRAGQSRAVGRGISLLENRHPLRAELVRELFPIGDGSRVVGVTGPPGAGKSTLVDRLARLLRERGERVGILAVDPTSPFTGGAILGDRIRMQKLYTDPGVFIRSMATRGAMGGLARASLDAVDVLAAAGYGWILVETVGVGQDEVDVVRCVDTVVMVTLPGLGDDIQAIKAGIMEIADVFVINKADRPGADKTTRDLEMVLGLAGAGEDDWEPPILRTVASRGEGIGELVEAVESHRGWLDESGRLAERRRTHLRLRVENLLKERVLERADEILGLEREVERAVRDGTDPYRVADRLFAGVVESAREGEGAQ